RIEQFFRHAYRLGLTGRLEHMGMTAPDLGGPLSANIAGLQDDMPKLHHLTELLTNDAELQQNVYPFVAIGGSRLKGYGEPSSDLDVAVFYKPSANPENREELRARLHQAFTD